MLGSQRCKDSGKFGYVIRLTPDFSDLQRSNCIQSHLISSPILTFGFVHVSLCLYPSVPLAKQPTSLLVVLLIFVISINGCNAGLDFRKKIPWGQLAPKVQIWSLVLYMKLIRNYIVCAFISSWISGNRARNNFRIVSGRDDRPNSFLLSHVSFLAG